MTRLQKTIGEITERFLKDMCPAYALEDAPGLDLPSSIDDENGSTVGCRGISCIECWNAEYLEAKND